jgi:hypothetical protein
LLLLFLLLLLRQGESEGGRGRRRRRTVVCSPPLDAPALAAVTVLLKPLLALPIHLTVAPTPSARARARRRRSATKIAPDTNRHVVRRICHSVACPVGLALLHRAAAVAAFVASL